MKTHLVPNVCYNIFLQLNNEQHSLKEIRKKKKFHLMWYELLASNFYQHDRLVQHSILCELSEFGYSL